MDLQARQRKVLVAAVGVLALSAILSSFVSSSRWINRAFPGFLVYPNLAVGPDFLPHWSGGKEGLRFLDRIVAVEGRPISRRDEIYHLVQNAPSGARFRYTVEREGKPVSIIVPSMTFTLADWLLTCGIYLIVGLGFLTLGVTPLYLRSPSPSSVPLFVLGSAVFFWFATTFDFLTTDIFPKEVRAFAFALTPSAGIHLGQSLTRNHGGDRRQVRLLYSAYGISILLGLFYSLSFYASASLWQWALWLGYIYSCLAALAFLGLLWGALGGPISDLERSRLRVVLGGAVLGFFLPTLGTVIGSSLLWNVPHNLLLIFTVFFPLSVVFALLKYDLFEIDAVFKVGLKVVLTGVLLAVYVLVVVILGAVVGIYESDLILSMFFFFLAALVFSPLLRWIETIVGHYIYRREYDPNLLQSEISSLLRNLSRPRSVAENYLKTVRDRVGIETAGIFCQPAKEEKRFMVSVNGGTAWPSDYPSALCSPWFQTFEARDKGISRDEVETDPRFHDARDELLRIFRELRVELLIPMIFENRPLGLVSLGRKKTGRGYSAEDFRILSNLSDHLALSLMNGMLFEDSEREREEIRRLYDETENMNRRLMEMDRRKKHFVANISHELRTPISTILGYTEVLLDPTFSGDGRTMLERIVKGGRDVSVLMDNLLDFTRAESGMDSLCLEDVEVGEFVESLRTVAHRLIRGRPIRFRSGIDPSVKVVKTDLKKLQQILMHLLTNAVKFTEEGVIAVEVGWIRRGGGDFVVFSVSDTGIGIGKSDQAAIFEEFHQLDGSSTRKYGGTGVGLSLCERMAESLGGKIEVESEPGSGSMFSLILPVRETDTESVSRPEGINNGG